MGQETVISEVQAYPISFPIKSDDAVTLGLGRMVKRDAVVVKVITKGALIGYGEAHHGRCPGAVAKLIQTTLAGMVVGMDALDVVGVWKKIYKMQLGSHGLGAAAAIALSGIDLALWDIRGKAVGWPLYKLLGGNTNPIPAYAGGVSLGYQEPEKLVDEVQSFVSEGYRAIKLRIGDTPSRDLERVAAVRKAFGDGLTILVDANASYTLDDAREAMPGLDDFRVGWLEEPFPAHDYRSYEMATGFGRVPLAAGENHYTRFEFDRLIECRAVQVLQPDISKAGGITELLRIAAMASACKLPIHPHTSITGLNMAASIHLLAAIENPGYFEADVSRVNPFRDQLTMTPYVLDENGCVRPQELPGIGLEVDEDFLNAHPVIEGPSYI
jgi:D-galactarolactone cycloisomerase